MIKRMNALLKKLDKRENLKSSEGYAKNCKIDGIHSYERVNEWTHYDAASSGAHIAYHHNILTDELTLFVDHYRISELD